MRPLKIWPIKYARVVLTVTLNRCEFPSEINQLFNKVFDLEYNSVFHPSIILSENLKRHLSSDFDMVTKKRRLNILPSESCIVTVLEDFVRHYAAGRLVAFEKQQRKSMYTAHKRGEGAGEMTYQRALEAIQVPGQR